MKEGETLIYLNLELNFVLKPFSLVFLLGFNERLCLKIRRHRGHRRQQLLRAEDQSGLSLQGEVAVAGERLFQV